MGYCKHLCSSADETLLFIQDVCQDGYVIDNVEIIELDHYVVTYHKIGKEA